MKRGDTVKIVGGSSNGRVGILKTPNTDPKFSVVSFGNTGPRTVLSKYIEPMEEPEVKIGDRVKATGPSGYEGLTGKVREIFNHGEIVVRLDGYSTDTCFHPRYLELVEDPNMGIEQRLAKLEEAVGIEKEKSLKEDSFVQVAKLTTSKHCHICRPHGRETITFHCKVETIGRIVILKWYKFPYVPKDQYMIEVDGWRISNPVSEQYNEVKYPVQKISKGSKDEAHEFFGKLVTALSEFADEVTGG